MNRIILIGNGFDMAHGLKTSYTSFLDSTWKSITSEACSLMSRSAIFENELVKVYFGGRMLPSGNFETYQDLIQLVKDNNGFIRFKNIFFETISKKRFENWFDIECEYFKLLMYVRKSGGRNTNPAEYGIPIDYTIETLNSEFNTIKLTR